MTFPKAKIWKCHFFVVPLQADLERKEKYYESAMDGIGG